MAIPIMGNYLVSMIQFTLCTQHMRVPYLDYKEDKVMIHTLLLLDRTETIMVMD